MDFQTIRLYGSMAIILGCFIFLYPKLLHPVVMTLFGMNEKVETKSNEFVPPALRDRHPHMSSPQRSADIPDQVKKNMRQGPHPGMRGAAAEQGKQAKGSGRGMMSIILPMYAVGIVVYLVYTLFKVFGKKDAKKDRGSRSPSPSETPKRRQADHRDNRQGSDDEGTVKQKPGDPMTPQQLKNQLSELHSLANMAKQKDFNEMDLGKLQERLAETEMQMNKILQAMTAVQSKVGVVIPQQGEEKTAMADSSNNQGAEQANTDQEHEKEALNTSDGSGASTESESYEIISKSNQSDRESSGEDASPIKVETLQSTASEQVPEEWQDEVVAEKEEEVVSRELEEEETEDVMMEEQKDKDKEEEDVTVRKRIIKSEDTQS